LRASLETPSGNVSLGEDPDHDDIALEIMACLLNDQDPWVRLWYSSDSHWTTQWTVIERNEDGIPVIIASSEFDGETQVINKPFEEDNNV